jgi:hypothetical protein
VPRLLRTTFADRLKQTLLIEHRFAAFHSVIAYFTSPPYPFVSVHRETSFRARGGSRIGSLIEGLLP